jgi:hypothetical protein
MPKFRLLLTRMVSEYAEVYVEAESLSAADDLTLYDIEQEVEDADWQRGESIADLAISDVEEED